MAMQLLSHSRKKDNGKTYTYYSIADSYWEDKKNKKKILFYLGTLTPLQAQKIRNVLRVTRSPATFVTTIDDLLFENHWRFLDVAFLNHLWDKEWGLSNLFPLPEDTSKTRKKEISTADIAKILTFYRCLDPGSYFSAVEWFETTACDLILGIDATHFNESRIYRELTRIEQQKEQIEKWLYQTLKERSEESMRVIFYDLSDSYFEGKRCHLAKPGRTKANGFKNKRVILSLLVNSEGYPFSWKLLENYTADVGTLKKNADMWKQQFNFPILIIVFDRGMVSDDNLKHLEGNKSYLYITALDKDQIAGVEHVNLDRFKTFTEETTEKEIISKGLIKYDDSTYYEDLGVDSNGRRHILVFNLDLLNDQRQAREELIEKAMKDLEEEKISLLLAKNSRQKKPTERRIEEELEKLKLKGCMYYNLERVELCENGKSTVKTFNLSYGRNVEAIEKAKLTDGVWMLVTNITENTEPKEYRLSVKELIGAYRDKNRIEEAFKEVKSFLKFQPTFVYTDEHVRAHYTICVLSYLLDMTVTNKLRKNPIDDVSSVRKVYRMLRKCEIGELSVKGTNYGGMKLMPLTDAQKKVLEHFNCSYTKEYNCLNSIGVKGI